MRPTMLVIKGCCKPASWLLTWHVFEAGQGCCAVGHAGGFHEVQQQLLGNAFRREALDRYKGLRSCPLCSAAHLACL